MQIRNHEIGVCSWSLQPRDMRDLVEKIKQLNLASTQIGFVQLLALDDRARESELTVLRESAMKLSAGAISFPGEDYASIAMIRKTGGFLPDATWEERRDMTVDAGMLAQQLQINRISMHIGFVPMSSDPAYAKIIARVAEIADRLGESNISLLIETGQEPASEMLQFLNDLRRRNVEVNFDPANMILYGSGDPVDAIRVLGRHIRHVHVKDATLSDQPRMKWGSEVPFGAGQVRPRRFLDALEAVDYTGPLVIEREAGEDRMADIRLAITALQSA
jgi:L-ribulose-5-phosphate 3-epimerase